MIKRTLIEIATRRAGILSSASHGFNDNPNIFGIKQGASKFGSICRAASRFIPAILLAMILLATPPPSYAHISIGIAVTTVEPPPLVVYEQPMCPGPGFIWTPGYWAWGPDGYFWVPGTWVLAPYPGELWTPGYWAWDDDDDAFYWSPGYWGPEVGFYGGIVYGYGYVGSGYQGGYWRGGTFFYNTAVNQVDRTTVTNVYNKTVINNTSVTYVSYNGGQGGTTARPTPAQVAVAHMRHDPPAPAQRQQEQIARSNRSQLASVNHGVPTVAATAKPTAFSGPGVVRARANAQPALAMNRGGANNTATRRGNPAVTRPANPTRPDTNIPVPNAKPNARPNANPQTVVPPKGQEPRPQPKQRLPESRPETQPHAQPRPEAVPPKRPNPPHAQENPHPTAQRREMTNPPRRTAPPQRTVAHSENPTRPVAMRRATPPPQHPTPRVTAQPRRMAEPPRPTPHRNSPPPQNAQHRDERHPPKGGR